MKYIKLFEAFGAGRSYRQSGGTFGPDTSVGRSRISPDLRNYTPSEFPEEGQTLSMNDLDPDVNYLVGDLYDGSDNINPAIISKQYLGRFDWAGQATGDISTWNMPGNPADFTPSLQLAELPAGIALVMQDQTLSYFPLDATSAQAAASMLKGADDTVNPDFYSETEIDTALSLVGLTRDSSFNQISFLLDPVANTVYDSAADKGYWHSGVPINLSMFLASLVV